MLFRAKKPVVVWIAVAIAVLAGVLAIAFVGGRERVSLTLLQYHRWPHGATLKLSNDTRRTIIYFTDEASSATLLMHKTPEGWTNASVPITSVYSGPIVGKLQRKLIYIFRDPSLSPAGPFTMARSRELKPGKSTELYVSLEPDGLPIRAGVVYGVPQGPVTQRFGQWMARVKQWCHLKSQPPGLIEVWCSEPLQVSAKPTRL